MSILQWPLNQKIAEHTTATINGTTATRLDSGADPKRRYATITNNSSTLSLMVSTALNNSAPTISDTQYNHLLGPNEDITLPASGSLAIYGMNTSGDATTSDSTVADYI